MEFENKSTICSWVRDVEMATRLKGMKEIKRFFIILFFLRDQSYGEREDASSDATLRLISAPKETGQAFESLSCRIILRFEFDHLRYTHALETFLRAYRDRGTDLVSAWVIVEGGHADRMRTAGMQIILCG